MERKDYLTLEPNPNVIEHSSAIALFLSLFFAGAGQVYNGQLKKGIMISSTIIILSIAIVTTGLYLLLESTTILFLYFCLATPFLFIPIFALIIYSIYDSFIVAETSEPIALEEKKILVRKYRIYVLTMFALMILITIILMNIDSFENLERAVVLEAFYNAFKA